MQERLFLAVFEDAERDIANRILQVNRSKRHIWEQFISCTYAFFEACLDSELRQIVLIDAPAVLGWMFGAGLMKRKPLHPEITSQRTT